MCRKSVNVCLLFTLMLIIPCLLHAQNKSGQVFDSSTMDALPFATIKFGNTGQGVVAGLDGRFDIPAEFASGRIPYIEISSLGYQSKKVALSLNNLEIYLQPQRKALNEVVVKPPYEKMRRIINSAIANKNKNNPTLFTFNYIFFQQKCRYKQ